MIKLENPKKETYSELCKRPYIEQSTLCDTVRQILARVKAEGDQALLELSKQFDGVSLKEILVAERTPNLSSELVQAIDIAARNIRAFHQAQLSETIEVETISGITCSQKALPISPVGLYIPAGSAPLFSTVLMLGIPAVLAGCKEIVLCSSPNSAGTVAPEILYCSRLLGIEKVYAIGGAQAIAAMAYGTETIPQVAKIFGPGNQYVTEAKRQVEEIGTGIDLPAGPSELVVIVDNSACADFVAADLLSQAEHGADSQVLLLSNDSVVIDEVLACIETQLESLPRKDIAKACLVNSKAIAFETIAEALDFSNLYAPEHLIINTEDADILAEQVTNAGSVFIGNYSPESAGDYASGTNHVLPTGGFARHTGGVSVASFQKKITFQKLTKIGLESLAPTIINMAKQEGLEAHSKAVEIRLRSK